MIEVLKEGWWAGEYLMFQDLGRIKPGAKTNHYNVLSKQTKVKLGIVKWWGQWRKYVFVPLDSVFDAKCLVEVSEFLIERSKDYWIENPRTWSREARKEVYLRNRLTKERNSSSIDLVETVPVPKKQVVEGVTPLEVELGTIMV